MKSNKEVIKVIYESLKDYNINLCYIFGSFLTARFTEESDIYIAISGDINLEDRLFLEGDLGEKIGKSIDLVNIEDLPKNIQLQIVSRNSRLIFVDCEESYLYLYELEKWYKEEYPFWLKLQRELGYEI